MAKNKKNKGKKSSAPLSPDAYIRKKARTLPIFECMINSDWKASGIAEIIIAHSHVNGNITLGLYLVDTYCLGLKDSFFRFNISIEEYNDLKAEFFSDMEAEKCDYMLAHNIIFGAIEFAEEFGFHPCKDFLKTTVNVLEKDDDHIELIDIEFGLNGKPCIFIGPNDNYANAIARLEKTAGLGNFEIIYVDANGEPLYDGDDDFNENVLEKDDFDEDELNEDIKEAFNEIEDMKDWTDKDWQDFYNGKKKLSENALSLFTDMFFYNQYEQEEVDRVWDKIEDLLDLEINYESINKFSEADEYYNIEEITQSIELIDDVAEKGNPKRAIQMTRNLIEQHPGNPNLYNNLLTYYQMAGKTRKTEDLIIYFYQKFPDYLFAKLHYALYLVSNGKINKVAKVLGNMWTLPELIPLRHSYHITEVLIFHIFLIYFYLETNKILEADVLYKAIKDYGIDEMATNEIKLDLQHAKMMILKDGLDKGTNLIQNDSFDQNPLNVVRQKNLKIMEYYFLLYSIRICSISASKK